VRSKIPNYCNDLNAIAEAETHLSEDQLEAMNTRIWNATMNTKYLWQVTARQRAMALIEAVDYCPKEAKSADPITYWTNPATCNQCSGKATPQVFVFKRNHIKINRKRFRYFQCDNCKIEWVEAVDYCPKEAK
jgi:predicted Zn-ribbon and HTH transcriptional regulator